MQVTENPNHSYDAIRHRAKLWLYTKNGVKKLFDRSPIGLLGLLLLISVFAVTWKTADIVAPLMAPLPILVPAIKWLVRILLFILIALLITGFLYLLGTPPKAREIENDLAAAFSIEKENLYRCPFLVSKKPVEGASKTAEYTFWGRWISPEVWNEPNNKSAVLWALAAYSSDSFRAGAQDYTVMIVATDGAVSEERDAPQDPLFM